MSILHTIAPFSCAARPRASWPMDISSATSCAPFVSAVVMDIADSQDAVGRVGTNHYTTDGSKRLSPGHLLEVST